ncbi:hypothetical protein [uncultured Albimonas sp.]|uniref:hypothetical protein n=1 Tax=uncultured Albimonas sp. TaxID=1331701 RepID=UPI0030ED95D6|tara:strand:+ start:124 stop:399 length:276 start_codon:yes stop_codon:yes gene_type:complete
MVIRTAVRSAARPPLVGEMRLLIVRLPGACVAVRVVAYRSRPTLTIAIPGSVRGPTLEAPFCAAQAVILLLTAGGFLPASPRPARLSEGAS